jgi:tripartite-type tricarboxylate transporter receptor subunit TctC
LPVFAGGLTTPAQQISAGTLKIIAVSSADRLPAFPDVPTFREAGYPQQVFTFWHGIAAPAGTPRAIIDTLHDTIATAMSSQGVRTVLGADQIPAVNTPEQFSALIRQDIETWGPVIRASNLVE